MIVPIPEEVRSRRVWRYLSFARFVWLLQRKALWLARADQLDDAWEGALSEQQALGLMDLWAKDVANGKATPYQDAEEALKGLMSMQGAVRRRSYVNCWNCSEDESHAMWGLYCRSAEGVAIQSTVDRLATSFEGRAEMLPVLYEPHNPVDDGRGMLLRLVSQKRPMFRYESELRLVVLQQDKLSAQDEGELGLALAVDPPSVIQGIVVHPLADESFAEVVRTTVECYEPELVQRVKASAMAAEPANAFLAAAKKYLGGQSQP